MIQLSPKDPAEIIPVNFDFSALVSSITSVDVTVAVKSGVDANASAMRAGAAVKSGAVVQQKIQNGVDGVSYYVRADAVSPEGNFVLVAVLPVTAAEKQ